MPDNVTLRVLLWGLALEVQLHSLGLDYTLSSADIDFFLLNCQCLLMLGRIFNLNICHLLNTYFQDKTM